MEPPPLVQPARDLLSSVTLGEYLATRPPRSVTCISTADSVGRVLRLFAGANLVAAPLFADSAFTQFIGFLDLMDIVAAVVSAARHMAGSSSPAAGSGAGGGSSHTLRQRAAAAARQLAGQPVGSIAATDNDAQLVYQAQLGNTLIEVVEEGFANPADHLKCHRLAVFRPAEPEEEDEEGPSSMDGSSGSSGGGGLATMDSSSGGRAVQVTHIISQSDILRFLLRHQRQLGEQLLGSTLEQLGFRQKLVMCVPADMAVIEALAGMADNKVPAVAVVDSFESGQLIGTLSISDLRGISVEDFELLGQQVGDFLGGGGLQGSPRGQPASPRGGVAVEFGIRSPEVALPRRAALAACTLRARFGDVLAQLAQRGIHRVFVVDEAGLPASVVSITDILRLIARPPEE